jgi:SAM-dependent methyltransferase
MCGSDNDRQRLRAPVVFGDVKNEKAFYECSNCSLIYMWPALVPEEEATFYAKEFEKFMEVRSALDIDWTGPEQHAISNADNVKRRWNAMEKFCPRNSKILEIGCSSGFMLDKFCKEGLQPVGVEPSGGFSNFLYKKGYEIFNDINDLPKNYYEYFDVVCHFFVLEHIADTRNFLKRKLELLRPGGVIFCEVPSATDPLTSFYNIPKFEEFYWSMAHHYYFSPDSISYLMSDLDIENYKVIPEQRYDLSNHMHWLQHGAPGGQGKLDHIFSDKMNEAYKSDLIKNGYFDTFFLVIWK